MVTGANEDLGPLLLAALEALPQPVMLYDLDRVVYANAASRRMLGARTAGDVLGSSLDCFLDPDFADASNERREYVIGQGLEFTDLRVKIRTLDGRTLTMRVDVRPFSFDGKSYAMVTLAI
jgi:PAS domain-containing protein